MIRQLRHDYFARETGKASSLRGNNPQVESKQALATRLVGPEASAA